VPIVVLFFVVLFFVLFIRRVVFVLGGLFFVVLFFVVLFFVLIIRGSEGWRRFHLWRR
jgi:hypothetical protein